MGNYVLVEKDAKLMKRCWKWAIIGTLIIIIATSFITSHAFHALNRNFNSNCISNAELVYKYTQYKNNATANQIGVNTNHGLKDENYANKVRDYHKDFQAYQTGIKPAHVDEVEAEHKTDIYQWAHHRQPALLLGTSTERAMNMTPEMFGIQKNDSDFFQYYEIDELNSRWGHSETCDNFYYLPLISAIVAIVWVVLIFISGYRGESTAETFIHKAWRFVLPAAVCFVILAICSAIYAGMLNNRLNNFCLQIKEKFSTTGIPCTLLIDRFSLNDADTAFMPSTNFNLSKSFPWLVAFLWAIAALIMLVRCVLGADFELEEVEHYNELTGSALEPSVPKSKVQFDDKIQNYTKETTYTPAKRPNQLNSNEHETDYRPAIQAERVALNGRRQ